MSPQAQLKAAEGTDYNNDCVEYLMDLCFYLGGGAQFIVKAAAV